jgi:HSP20 family protein
LLLPPSGTRPSPPEQPRPRAERPYGSFLRTLTLPKGVDSDRIRAEYHDGVLELQIPKPAEIKPKKIAISTVSPKQIEK